MSYIKAEHVRQFARGFVDSPGLYLDLTNQSTPFTSGHFLVFTYDMLSTVSLIKKNGHLDHSPTLLKLVYIVTFIWVGTNFSTLLTAPKVAEEAFPQVTPINRYQKFVWDRSTRICAVVRITAYILNFRRNPIESTTAACSFIFLTINFETNLVPLTAQKVYRASNFFGKAALTWLEKDLTTKTYYGFIFFINILQSLKKRIENLDDTYETTKRNIDLKTLGLPPETTYEQLQTYWKTTGMKNHPDKGGNEETWNTIFPAYKRLREALANAQPSAKQ